MVVVFASGTAFGDVTRARPGTLRARRPAAAPGSHGGRADGGGDPAFGTASPVQRLAGVVRDRFAAVTRETLPAGPAAIPAGSGTRRYQWCQSTGRRAVQGGRADASDGRFGANVTIVCGAALLAAMFIGPRAAVLLAGVALLAFVVVVQPTASVCAPP